VFSMAKDFGLDEQYPLDFLKPGMAFPAPLTFWTLRYVTFKFICDKGFAILCLPFICLVALVLWALNPFFNPGPLFFSQHRMGMGGRRFNMWKFRTMNLSPVQARAHDAPLEADRITAFGGWLRKFRIDELPNFFNVLSGDMSLIGPRPDAWGHSTEYAKKILHYSDRFRVRPGITGLAQVRGGYADSRRAVQRKARFDSFYVRKSRIKLDLHIIWRTIGVVLTGFGGR